LKVILFANTDWYIFNYRLPLARALKKEGNEVILMSPPGRYSHLLEQEGFRWLSFPLERKRMNPFAEIMTIIQLFFILKSEKPGAVHFFTIKPVLYGSFAAHICGVPKIINAITGLGYIFSNANLILRNLVLCLYRISLHKTSVIFQNPADLDIFVTNKLISKNQAYLIPGSGVDTEIFHLTQEPSGIPVIMLASRLLRSKGIPEFVEAARQIKHENISARFVIVGEPYTDNPDSIMQDELNGWQNEGTIELWGWHDDMADVISKASIVCLPTTYFEGLPRLLIEAGACGRPVVTTDIPGCRMVVINGENGIIIPPGDINALIIALKSLIQNSEMRHAMGHRNREIVERNFSIDMIISKTLELYKYTN